MITFFEILAVLGMIYGIGSWIAFFITRSNNREDSSSKILNLPFKTGAIITGFTALILLSCIVRIGAQDVGVVVTPGGVRETELHTGWHLVAPWNNVYHMDKTVWVYTFSNVKESEEQKGDDAIWTPTKDGIKMGMDVSINWRIDPDFASWIYANVSDNDEGLFGRYIWLEENIIRAKTKSALALTVSTFTPIEVYSNKREDIQQMVAHRMKDDLLAYHLILDQVNIREVFYNPEYEKAINSKKLAEQEVLRLVEVTKQKKEQLLQAEINKNMQIEIARGEAEALRIKGNSIAENPKIIELQWIEKWNGSLPQTYLGGGGSDGLILNLNK